MNLSDKNILITGGAGFIGSHLSKSMVDIAGQVKVIDNLSSGRISNLRGCINKSNFKFIKGDLLKPRILADVVKDCEMVFHLSANSEVRAGVNNPKIDFDQNLKATHNLLETLRKSNSIETLVFTSSSTVYGEPSVIPTPEGYGSMKPISLYGASKLGCESLISAHSNLYNFNSIIYRFANVVGSRSTHGVIFDFIKKLNADDRELEILGNGNQTKSYIHVSDVIDAMLLSLKKVERNIEIFNIGSEDQVNVKTIAEIVASEMGLKNTNMKCKGGDEGRGWPGDVKFMILDIQKIKQLGWRPKYNSFDSVRLATKEIIEDLRSDFFLEPCIDEICEARIRNQIRI